MEKIFIKTPLKESDRFLLDLLRGLFPECEVHIVAAPYAEMIREEACDDA